MWFTSLLTFWNKGGWKIFVIIGVAAGLIGSAWYISSRLERLGVIETQLEQLQQQQKKDIERITQQNQEVIDLSNTIRDNTATISNLRRQLSDLSDTITPNLDPTIFNQSLQSLVDNQYNCIELLSQGETDASCQNK